jgi:outer membrane biosynthesis protein TonB
VYTFRECLVSRSTTQTKRSLSYQLALQTYANITFRRLGPPVKKKAAEGHASFAAFLGQAGVAGSAAPAGGEPKPKPQAPVKVVKKRKATDEAPEDAEDSAKDLDPPSATEKSEGDKSDSKKKKVPAAKKGRKTPDQKKEPAKAKGRPKKAVKKEESASEEEVKDNSVENSADGGDGPCKFYFNKRLRHCWTRLTVT